jgi:L-fuculose-phosphate aldolase
MSPHKKIIYYSKCAYERGYTVASEGNISMRLSNNRFLITPSNLIKPLLNERDLVEIDIEGNTLKGKLQPSTERFTHLEIYRNNPDIKAIIHAHPPFSVLATIIGSDPFKNLFLAEAAMFLHDAVIAPYAKPSTREGAASISTLCSKTRVLLIEKHGSFTYAHDLHSAYSLLEILEKYCTMHYYAQLSGKNISYLSEEEAVKLSKIQY